MARFGRRISRSGLAAVSVLTLACDLWPAPTGAQPFGFFFDDPRPRRAVRRRRAVPQPVVEERQAEVPLPPPRPRFPGDPAPPGEVAGTSAPASMPAPAKPPPPPADKGPPRAQPALETRPTVVAKPVVAKPDASPPQAPGAPLPPPKPPELSTAPGAPPSTPPKPGVAASGARLGETPGQPIDDASCPGRLKDRKVAVDTLDIGPQPDPRCTVVQAVRLASLTMPDGSKVDFPEHPTIACTTADAFSLYVRDLLSPLAKGTFGAPVAAVWTGPGLECRSRDHVFGAKLSAHGQGLAIDIAQLKLADGRLIEVGQPKTDADTGFETAARAAACGYFHTVLGPGSDAYHRTHWHFDLEVRGAHGDSKFCK